MQVIPDGFVGGRGNVDNETVMTATFGNLPLRKNPDVNGRRPVATPLRAALFNS